MNPRPRSSSESVILRKPHADKNKWLLPAICGMFAVLIVAIYAQTRVFPFINYDDGEYVYQNPHVTNGITLNGFAWAFTHAYAANWHPLTWITHMADWQLYGANAGPAHVENVALHAAAACLLFLVLRTTTGATWRPAFVAGFFALHPLRVESVAWVAERKDVLSGLFFMLTLWAYGRWAAARRGSAYWAALLFCALGLMSKPSLVTLPFVLLLLDYWPLARFDTTGWRRLFLEKAPFLVLSAASCLATIFAQRRAIMPIARFPLAARLGNAAWSYVVYLWQMVDPVGLAVFYPLRIVPWWAVTVACLVLASVTAGVIFARKTRPWLLVGWFWYLGMLVPMIGIMQVGGQAHADRYTYLSGIGIAIAVTWEVCERCARLRSGAQVLGWAGASVLIILTVLSYVQTACWRDSESLWAHTLAVTDDSSIAHNMMAMALLEKGRPQDAMAQFQTALRLNPNDPGTHLHIGVYLARNGRLEDGIAHLRRGVELAPGDAGAEADLALALASDGRAAEAMPHYRKALDIDPDFPDALNDLAWALATSPDPNAATGAEAVKLAEHCCEITSRKIPEYLDTLAAAYARAGNFPQAMATVQSALQLTGSDTALAQTLDNELARYRKGMPLQTGDTAAKQ